MRKFLLASALSSLVALSAAAEWETIQPTVGEPFEQLTGDSMFGIQGYTALVWQDVNLWRNQKLVPSHSLYWETPIPVLCDYPDPLVMATFGSGSHGKPRNIKIKGVSADHTAVFLDDPETFRMRLEKEGSVMITISDHCDQRHTAKFSFDPPE